MKHRGNYFRMIITYYTPFLLILILIAAVVCLGMYDNQLNKHKTTCETAANAIAASLDGELNKLQKTSILLFKVVNAGNPVRFKGNGEASLSYYDMNNLMSILSTTIASQDYLERVALYLPAYNRLITNAGVFLLDEYYSLYPHYAEIDSCLYAATTHINEFRAYPLNKARSVLPILANYQEISSINAKILLNLNCEFFTSVLSRQNLPGQSQLAVADVSGAKIYSTIDWPSGGFSGDTHVVDGEKYMVTAAEVPFMGWNIYLLTQKSAYLPYRFLAIYAICAIVFFTLCTLLSLFLSYRLYRPIENLLRTITGSGPDRGTHELDLVSQHISSLRASQTRLEADFAHTITMVREDVLRRIIMYSDESMEQSELDETLEKYVIQLNEPCYFLGVVDAYYARQDFETVLDRAHTVICQALVSALKESVTAFCPDATMYIIRAQPLKHIMIINGGDKGLYQGILEACEAVADKLKRQHPFMRFVLALSPCQDSLLSLSKQYKRLCEELSQYRLSSNEWRLSPACMDPSAQAQLPAEFDENLRRAVIAGRPAELAAQLKSVFTKSLENSLTPRKFQQLVGRLTGIYNALAAERAVAPLSPSALSEQTPIQRLDLECTLKLFIDMFQKLSQGTGTSDTVGRMEQFVRDHYQDDSLCLTTLSDAFHFSENHLSHLFKLETGQTFTDFLSDCRIRRAKTLLLNMELRVDDIAAMVGLPNRRTFNRVFKKVAGVSPSMYRVLNSQGEGVSP